MLQRLLRPNRRAGKDTTGRGFELAYVALSLTSKLFLSVIVASNLWFNPDDA